MNNDMNKEINFMLEEFAGLGKDDDSIRLIILSLHVLITLILVTIKRYLIKNFGLSYLFFPIT
jgi:hypothetical protein